MTNRAWLSTLSSKEVIVFIFKIWPTIANGYSDSVAGMLNWLDQEHIPNSWITEQLEFYGNIKDDAGFNNRLLQEINAKSENGRNQ